MADDRPATLAVPSRLAAAVRAAVGRRELLDPGDHVLVGVSGGPDSVALLHALVLLRSEYALRVEVCHVHHGLRPEADRDAAFVESLGRRLGCPVHVVRVEVPRRAGRASEAAARAIRHVALGRVARRTGARRIALGHTADDQAETVLMRILEGAGPRGLAGIPAQRGRIVRPLLDVDRAAVDAHLAAHDLASVDDATNRDPAFFRNRIRHGLLPLLAAEAGPHVRDALRRVARASRETVTALDALVRPRLTGRLTPTPVGWRLALAALAGLPAGAVKALLRLTLVEIAAADCLASGLRRPHLDALAALPSARTGARVRLPHGVVVERGRDALWVVRPARLVGPEPLAVPGRVRAGDLMDLSATIEPVRGNRPDDPAWEAWFDAAGPGMDPAAGALLVRPWRPGEGMVPFGGAGPVRLTTLLAAAGVPRLARARWPIVADREGGVLWLPGVRRGARAPLTAETRAVLCLRAVPGPPGAPAGDAV